MEAKKADMKTRRVVSELEDVDTVLGGRVEAIAVRVASFSTYICWLCLKSVFELVSLCLPRVKR